MDNGEMARIVYEASVRAAREQAAALDGLRVRAGTVLAASTLVSSFLGGQAIAGAGRVQLASLAGLALGAFAVSALLTLLIVWPFDFRFALSARAMIRALDDPRRADPVLFLRVLALQVEGRYHQNRRLIRRLQWGFQLAIFFLAVEVAAWMIVLWRA